LAVVAARAVLPGAAPVAAAAGGEASARLERGEVAEIRIGDEHHVAAGAAVAPVGAALRDVLLTAKAERTVAAAPRLNVDCRAVVEHGARVASARGAAVRPRSHGRHRF